MEEQIVSEVTETVRSMLITGAEGLAVVDNDRYSINITLVDKTKAKDYRDPVWLADAYVQQNRTMADIATEFGITPMAVNHWLLKHNIQTRPRGSKTQR